MRNTDEQLREIMRRAELVKEKRNDRRLFQESLIAVCACLILLTVVSVHLPRFAPALQSPEMRQYGSLLLAAPFTGYVVVGMLAFALGICVTLLCVHWKALRRKEDK